MKKIGILIVCWVLLTSVSPAEDEYIESSKYLHLSTAVTCEDVKDHTPYNTAIIFPISLGKVYCFTLFDTVTDKTNIYHSWYRADKLTTRKKLAINPPKWSTFSAVYLRESDKGPWRVEISDQDGKILTTVRFSITD